jgi:hypothetical protein
MPMLVYVAVLALAHVFDYVSFLAMVGRHGLTAEANPLVVGLIQEAGLPGLTVAKFASVLLAGFAAVVLYQRRPRLAMAVVIFGTAAGIIGGLSNVVAL